MALGGNLLHCCSADGDVAGAAVGVGVDVEDGAVVGEIDIDAEGAGSEDETGSEDALTSTQLRS